MLRSLAKRRGCLGTSRWRNQKASRGCLTTDSHQRDEPLRILFCGTEDFSGTALKALHDLQQSAQSGILSIDVATRKDKYGGRGMKQLRSPPIKRIAAQLGLRLHQFDTFTGWHPPEYLGSSQPYINLVVAVSFGLLVPPRILRNATYGGLNVHPSMLPELRGAAPINWTILKGHTHTGVSVQTLHPSKFDHGVVLDQTPEPGIAIPNPTTITAHQLRLLLAPVGADMLVQAIQNKLYLQPYREKICRRPSSIAPKIVPSMKVFDPYHDQLQTILRKTRSIPRLWAEAVWKDDEEEGVKRVVLGPSLRAAGEDDLPIKEMQDIADEMPVGLPFAFVNAKVDVRQSDGSILVKMEDGSVLAIPNLLVEGSKEGPAAASAARSKLVIEASRSETFVLYKFYKPLILPQV